MNARFPESIRPGIEAALTYSERRDSGGTPPTTLLEAISPLTGGCVSPAARVRTSSGLSAFVKWNRGEPTGLFEAEAEGLRHLARTAHGHLRVPNVLGVGDDGSGTAWLLLEFIPSGPEAEAGEPTGTGSGESGATFGIALGRGMAAVHRAAADGPGADRYGWRCDNFIGPLKQHNTASASWPAFWRDERLGPQLAIARENGYFRGREGDAWDDVLDATEELLEGAELDGISLVHGDFWSGNVFPGRSDEPVVIDPAVYRGHREVDLAMAELFGGFPADFLPAYREAWPLRPGYERMRRDVYQLYPLLVHVNLFGGGYSARATEKVNHLLRL
jgi:fructosamine-3-kinase